jgi:hypothetical protein
MNDELVERLLEEVVATRTLFATATEAFTDATTSFNEATGHIKWNRTNTVIQYVLIVAVALIMALGFVYYKDDKRETCERGNDLRMSIQNSLDANAAAIGVALVIVADAPEGTFQEYMKAYQEQDKPEALKTREC